MATTILKNASRLFPSSDQNVQLVLFDITQFLQNISHKSIQLEFYIAIVGVILTIFHIFILSRKSMMTSSVIAVMVSVAVFDISAMLISIGVKNMLFGAEGSRCTPPVSYLSFQVFWIFIAVRDMVQRSSTWLVVLLALIRYSALKFATKQAFLHISRPSFGAYAVSMSLMPSMLLSSLYWMRYELHENGMWKPEQNCSNYNQIDSLPIFEQKPSKLFTSNGGVIGKSFMFVNGLTSKIIPCVLLPLLTCLLIQEIRKNGQTQMKLRNSARSRNNEKTTGLVIIMAISFFISELPIGTVLVFQVAYTDIGFLYLATYVTHICNLMFTTNSITHCIILFAMSSQYRKTVRFVLHMKRAKRKNVIPKVSPKISTSSKIVPDLH